MVKVKYVDDDKSKGILVDWKFIFKEYKKLGCPKDVYNPCTLPIYKATYHVLLSERKTGKTTNVLLIGLLLYWHYGIVTPYIRQTETMIMNKNVGTLMDVVKHYGYIEKITDGKYNDIIYHARKWYLVKVENDEIVEQDVNFCMYCLALDCNEVYKSNLNLPTGDWIIFDEFISKRYRMNEFVDFADLLSTIIRKRVTANIIMLANTIDIHSDYFLELEIYEEIQTIRNGEKEILTTERGTKIYYEWIKTNQNIIEKTIYNALYFGFKNPKISAITGSDWALSNYPHIQRGFEKIYSGIYVEYNNRLLALDIVKYDDIGICINCHKATRTYDDSYIYSLSEPKDKRYHYYMGMGNKLDRLIVDLVEAHKIRFQNNSCGTMFYNHYDKKGKK